MQEAKLFNWSKLPTDAPMPLLSRKRVIGEKMMISELVLQPGCTVPVHHHENEQFSCVLRGHLRFTVLDATGVVSTVEVRDGDVLHLPSHVPHGVVAIEETLVLDLFSPPSAKTGIDQREK